MRKVVKTQKQETQQVQQCITASVGLSVSMCNKQHRSYGHSDRQPPICLGPQKSLSPQNHQHLPEHHHGRQSGDLARQVADARAHARQEQRLRLTLRLDGELHGEELAQRAQRAHRGRREGPQTQLSHLVGAHCSQRQQQRLVAAVHHLRGDCSQIFQGD